MLSLLQSIAFRLEAIENKLGLDTAAGGGGGGHDEDPRSIRAFDAYCNDNLAPFVVACAKLGPDTERLGGLTQDLWKEMRGFLLRATACKEPAPAALGSLLAGAAAKMKEIKSSIKRDQWEKHAKTVDAGIECVNWLCVKPAPRDYIETFIGGSDYWANSIRKEYRTTNPDQIAFCETFKNLIKELMVYVKEFHTTGVSWNSKGCDVSEYVAGSAPAAVAKADAKVAPQTTAAPAKAVPSAAAAPPVNLAAMLSKGGEITSGLKTVTKDMQTWRSEYKGGDAPAPVAVKKAPAAKVDVAKGPAKVEFQGGAHKWFVENQTGANGIVTINIGDKKETVYVFGCVGATINVVGKCKGVTVDGCKKTEVQFDDIMASCEVVNSVRIKILCREKVASVAIDKTDGIVVVLPQSSMDTTIVASKSSEMNLSWPGPDGELVEKPIPEQYVHRIKDMRITAEVSDLYGH